MVLRYFPNYSNAGFYHVVTLHDSYDPVKGLSEPADAFQSRYLAIIKRELVTKATASQKRMLAVAMSNKIDCIILNNGTVVQNSDLIKTAIALKNKKS